MKNNLSISIRKSLLIFLLPSLFTACAHKNSRANEKLEKDFFAVVTDIVEIRSESDARKGLIQGSREGAIQGGKTKEPKYGMPILATLGAIYGGIKGLAKDLTDINYQYQYNLLDVDSGIVHVFFSDIKLGLRDCVYIDGMSWRKVDGVKQRKANRHIEIKKVDTNICTNNAKN